MIDRINTIREALEYLSLQRTDDMADSALAALAELEAAMREPYATIEHTVGGSIEHMPLKSAWQLPMGVKFDLYLAAPPAQQRNEWKEAVLDKLAEHCIDAPQDEPPASILSRIIAVAVQMATDPAINTPAQQAQPTEPICPTCKGSGEGGSYLVPGTMANFVDGPCRDCGGSGLDGQASAEAVPSSCTHALKLLPEYFADVKTGTKTFELRKDDRGFKVGDVLRLKEWSEPTGFTGKQELRVVTSVLRGPVYGLADGFVILSIASPQQAQAEAYTYASRQATMCAGCGKHKHTPLRIDAMGGYVCLFALESQRGLPMSTAPKDGTQILAKMADSDSRIVVCWAAPGGPRANLAPNTAGWHVAWDGYGPLDEPECWWPLP